MIAGEEETGRARDPGEQFRRRKGYTLAALDVAPSITMLTAKKRAKLRAEFVKMKRPALAAEAAKRLQGWLPELLITPALSGAFAVTPDGEAAASTIAAE